MEIREQSKIQIMYLNSTHPHMPACISIASSTRKVKGKQHLIKYDLEGKRKQIQIRHDEC